MSKAPARSDTTEAYVRGLRRGGREALLLIAAGVTIYLFMALVSYAPSDPGWSAHGLSNEVHNLGGVTGAWLADVMLSLFGWPGYLVPWFVLYAGWLGYQGREAHNALAVGARTTASMLMLISLCALTTGWSDGRSALPQGEGGIVGNLVVEIARAGLGNAGSAWFLVVLAAVSLSIATGFSWLQVAEWIGTGLFGAIAGFAPRLRGLLARRAESAPLRVKRAEPAIARPVSAPPPAPSEDKPRRKRSEPTVNEPSKGQAAQLQLLMSSELPKPRPGTDPIPPLELLDLPKAGGRPYTEDELTQLSQQLERHLADFGVEARVVGAEPGPVITRFELEPAPGVKGSQISNLAKDLARSLSVMSVRVVEVIPGKSYVGLEIPNQQRELVALREILQSEAYQQVDAPLALALGKDIAGHPVVVDLARMPHMLVAGTTGSGKSVAINVMVLSLLFRRRPQDVRLIMIDPKMLELSVYEGIPHLLTPVVTDMKEAANALRWCVAEMERRYRVMATVGVRNLAGFNRKLEDAAAAGTSIPDPLYKPELALDPTAPAPALTSLPHIVVIVDELADMMMVVGKKVEELIARLAQKARAAGIHLILATQRPSVDVITGLIKANIPARVAFQVSSRIDSRTILDQMGAESLLGHGDMLYLPPGTGIPRRVHGAFVDDHEVHKVVGWLKQTGTAVYLDEVLMGTPEVLEPGLGGEGGDAGGEDDPLYDEAVRIVTESRKASISWVQRRLRIGYNRAARLVEQMESAGVVGPLEANGSREVLAPPPPEN